MTLKNILIKEVIIFCMNLHTINMTILYLIFKGNTAKKYSTHIKNHTFIGMKTYIILIKIL